MVSRLTTKGQVTIPKPLRESLGLEPGHELEFEERNGGLLVRRRPAADPLGQLVGLVAEPADVDAYLAAARGAGWEASRDGEVG